jgi:hypothetical protein
MQAAPPPFGWVTALPNLSSKVAVSDPSFETGHFPEQMAHKGACVHSFRLCLGEPGTWAAAAIELATTTFLQWSRRLQRGLPVRLYALAGTVAWALYPGSETTGAEIWLDARRVTCGYLVDCATCSCLPYRSLLLHCAYRTPSFSIVWASSRPVAVRLFEPC